MRHAMGNEAFRRCPHRYLLDSAARRIDDQRVAAPRPRSLLVEVVNLRRGWLRLAARPERHLAAIDTNGLLHDLAS